MDVEKQIFDILFSGLKAAKAEYLRSVYTAIASILAGIGWFLTSKETRSFFASHAKSRYFLICTIIFLAILHWSNVFQMASRSHKTLQLIKDNCFVKASNIGEQYFAPFIVYQHWPYFSCVFTAALFFILIYIIAKSNSMEP